MRAANLLVLLSDEHNPKLLGAAGHPFIRTPTLNALAARGTRFAAAYTPCPICVPARAALATGRPIHAMGHWDNADPYAGASRSWHHAVRQAGHSVVSIGKLHFRGLPGDDHGFSQERLAMHVVDGTGDLLSLIRDETAPRRKGAAKLAASAAAGESDYTRYDRAIAADAASWLRTVAPTLDRPWVLFVSLVTPHFPLIAPEPFFGLYPPESIPLPKAYHPAERPSHPFLRDYASVNAYDAAVRGPDDVRRMLAGYFGLVSFMDHQLGQVLGALEAAGLGPETRVLYASDHGDNAGARGLWGKSTMFEESVGIPLIMAGPDVPAGRVVPTPVSLLDVYPTVLDALGLAPERPSPLGDSLFAVIGQEPAERPVIAEYHASGSREAAFMLRLGRWKYVRHVTYPPMLFDLAADPEELDDRGTDPGLEGVRAMLEARLLAHLDPVAVNARARQRQAELLASHGGREAVLARGEIAYSPPPGVAPAWS